MHGQTRKRDKAKASPGKGKGRQKPAPEDTGLLFGRHAVDAAIGNPHRRVLELFASSNAAHDLQETAKRHHIPLSLKTGGELAAMLQPGAVHQGLVARVDPLPEIGLHDLTLKRPILVLDQVTDPHNVGAILRSAAVFNAAAIVMTRRNSPPLSGTLAKSACGGLEHVHVIYVGNLAQALRELGEIGFYRIGLAGEADRALEDGRLQKPVALVLGAEDKGLRRLTRENCDLLCHITTGGPLSSLNVSNAAAVALHAIGQAVE